MGENLKALLKTLMLTIAEVFIIFGVAFLLMTEFKVQEVLKIVDYRWQAYLFSISFIFIGMMCRVLAEVSIKIK